ncbi:Nucleoside-diphosphate-sugar epimerase [Methylomagnum ishizawai]|uniref:Nucleoside-diphosphate-sugar epimerase n=1 Tax=Methylomagnum ishizawai TaxID=1760988 RepID=A0A1Y6D6E7_9GAMM|nr:NAD(P)-dependent oxidoreductase [Methylomagnum ishizawai]SMF96413.1 Nucleoside-diphosphate-sugar epimerase [Methylomagnum ishizawai]
MKIFVTGATGFIGSHLVPHLLGLGHEVGCASRSAEPPRNTRTWSVGPDGLGFRAALAEFRPEVVVHLAALYIAEHRYEEVGSLVTANLQYGAYLLDAMRDSGCGAMVYAGTAWQHYENADYRPANLYAATKQAFSTLAEYYLDALGMKLLELHLYDSYGEGDPRKKLIDLLKFYAGSTDTLAMSQGNQRLHLVHIDDLARGFALACEQVRHFGAGERRVYRLPSKGAVSLRALVDAFNAADPAHPVRVAWGARPYREREVFEPWENTAILPGWWPEIDLATGLSRLRRQESPP